jgi:hypothetical protein
MGSNLRQPSAPQVVPELKRARRARDVKDGRVKLAVSGAMVLFGAARGTQRLRIPRGAALNVGDWHLQMVDAAEAWNGCVCSHHQALIE